MKTSDAVHEVISGGPRDRPRFAQALARLQNFFHDDPGLGSGAREPLQIRLGIAKTVCVIDTDAVKHALQQPSHDQAMRVGENPSFSMRNPMSELISKKRR